MTILDPDHLLDQATQLCSTPAIGAPRQANLRRAISSAYYALFHAIVADVADQIAGKGQRDAAHYSLVYRSISHRRLSELCENIAKQNLRDKYRAFEPQGGFGADLIFVSNSVVELQEKRHSADYDPLYRVTASDTTLNVQTARTALQHWRNVPKPRRRVFVLMLAFL